MRQEDAGPSQVVCVGHRDTSTEGGDDQLPEGRELGAPLSGWLSSVLWLDGAGAEDEEELTPLEVLTELCWMASL